MDVSGWLNLQNKVTEPKNNYIKEDIIIGKGTYGWWLWSTTRFCYLTKDNKWRTLMLPYLYFPNIDDLLTMYIKNYDPNRLNEITISTYYHINR